MDKIREENSLPSNLTWFSKYNMKIDEKKPAGSFDRLSKNQTHKQNHHKPTTMVESLKRPGKKLSQERVLGNSAGLRSLTEVCSGNAASIAWEEPTYTETDLPNSSLGTC